jgi:hypothetical protein
MNLKEQGMKRTFIITLVLTLVFFFAACGGGSSSNRFFGIGFGVVGVINGDRIQFYENEGDTWETDSDNDFILPKGYKGLFSPGFGVVGVINGDRIQFYENEGDTWDTDSDNDFIIK